MNMIKYTILIAISLIVVAVTMPTALYLIASATLTGVNGAVTTIFTIVLPILAILGIALGYMPEELKDRIGM